MKKSRMILIIILIAIIMVLGILSFGPGASQRIDIVGSTSVQPVAEKLVEEYKINHPDVKINVQGGGSSLGIKTVHDGIADIGMSSKELDSSGKEGISEYEIGKDGIVVAVNVKNNVSDLTKSQLKDIFSGKITNWREVGGNDGEIHIVCREAGSGTLNAFEDIVMGDAKIKRDAIVQSSTEAVKQSVKQDENAIGFVSFAHVSDDVKTLNIGGVTPGNETIADGSYELQRPFLFLVKGNPSGELKKFIDWTGGSEAQKIIEEEKIIKSTE
ncbi:phosphate ABC transporter substrate-binding protein [Methanobrevibacter sp.]|uniref:phosphate ABC transporter substrate-binding protein n=1 Tax=Methanobrevibacter sp. TaxID=66852 RepID=UPI00388E6288